MEYANNRIDAINKSEGRGYFNVHEGHNLSLIHIYNHGTEMTGTVQRKSNGKNSFIPEGGGEPIFVAERNSAHAMNLSLIHIFPL